jgi:leader peptidase (prepilin peptidase)/N-methyltransferase
MSSQLLVALLGLAQGPWLHSIAVAVGRNEPVRLGLACPQKPDDPNADHRGGFFRCGCGRIRWREALTAIGVGLVYWLMARTLGINLVLAAHLTMVSITAMLIITDFDHFRIPNRILYPGGALCVVALTAAALVEDQSRSLLTAAIGAAIYSGLLFVVFLIARGEGFGFGDVKLAVLLGFFAGFHTLGALAYALFLTSLIGGIPALVLLVRGRRRDTAIPYGPPLIFGTWVTIIWAPSLLG